MSNYIIIGIVFIIIGTLVMIKHRFYKYDPSDMLFATELKIFLGGLTLALAGFYILFLEI